MSIDSTRIEQLATNINTIWTSPLTICLSLYFLWGYLGPASLAGLVVMVVLIPVNGVLSSQMKKYQIANMKNKDTRIKVRKRNLFLRCLLIFRENAIYRENNFCVRFNLDGSLLLSQWCIFILVGNLQIVLAVRAEIPNFCPVAIEWLKTNNVHFE